ncbi:META domain-containing protein [Rhodovastum atsumiense]|uniref:META domain-containing protein n=1 Tax=Rhodovastum atsumiense TaxID=504468 RepID=UPI00139F2C8A|nr:META domain-containing protein [Rhodovastum atsumiense]
MSQDEFSLLRDGLENHRWLLVSYGGHPVLDGTRITAAFRDGRVSGTAGCNSYSASYERSARELDIGPAISTRIYCTGPEGVMTQERDYLGLLESAARYRVGGDRLTIADATGYSILEYRQSIDL